MTIKIAILLTCHNRKNKTIDCLTALFHASLPDDTQMEVFLVDDGSTDNTSESIEQIFPQVHITIGSGSLFWNQGMRLAWQKAIEFGQFDYFLWLNDDTIIDQDSILELLKTDEIIRQQTEFRLITAACRATNGNEVFSYGGRQNNDKIIPNGNLQTCNYINGNLVLIPEVLFNKIGMLSPYYTHGIGDNDYGLRTIEAGGKCYTSLKYLATCPPNEGIPGWCNPKVSFKKRWQLLHSPKGLNIKEYNHFRKRFWGVKWFIFAFKAYAKTIVPKFYNSISKS